MKIATIMLAAAAALSINISSALAQDARTGMVTRIDRINGTVAIAQTESGTVGANTGGAAEDDRVQSGLTLDAWHAGDKVTYSATETGGVKTITKIEKR